MADKNYTTEQVTGGTRHIYLYGDLIQVEPGMYILTDTDGNVTVADEETYLSQYASDKKDVAGEVQSEATSASAKAKNQQPSAQDEPPASTPEAKGNSDVKVSARSGTKSKGDK